MSARSKRPFRESGARAAGAGFTILELMVVIALAAFLLTLGASVFLSGGKGAAYRQMVQSVSGLISSARDASSSVPAAVVVDPEGRKVFGLTSRNVQELHFEPYPAEEGEVDPTVTVSDGIRGFRVERMDGEILPTGGRTGGGLRLTAGQVVDCGAYPAYDSRNGVHASLWISASRRAVGTLVQKGASFKVALDGPSRLTVQVKVDDQGGPEDVTQSVEIPPIAPGAWVGVQFTYDRQSLIVSTDHGYGPVERGRWAETRPLRLDPDASLVVGSAGFDGVIDDFVFAVVHSSEPLIVPPDVLLLGKPQTIRFSGGQLDETAHQALPSIAFQFGDRITTLEIGRGGLVSNQLETSAADGPAPTESADPRFEKAE